MPIIDKHTNTIDCAIRTKGSMEALFDLVLLNDLSITDDLIAGNIILTPEGKYEGINAIVNTIDEPILIVAIPKHLSPIDMVIMQKGNITGLFELSALNDASITEDLIPGNTWMISTDKTVFEPVIIPIVAKTESEVLKKHQTFLDYTTQHSGSLDGLFEMAQLNGLTITENVVPGTSLQKLVFNNRVAEEYKKMGVDVVSNKDLGIEITVGGIGAMQIGNTFKTS
jgi:hypothetical protein